MTRALTLATLRQLAPKCEPEELLATIIEEAVPLAALFGVTPALLVERVSAVNPPELPLRIVEADKRRQEQLRDAGALAKGNAGDAAAARCVTHVGVGEVEVDLSLACEAARGVDLLAFEDDRGAAVYVDSSRLRALGALKRPCEVSVDALGLHARWSATGGLNLAPQYPTDGPRRNEQQYRGRTVRRVLVAPAAASAPSLEQSLAA